MYTITILICVVLFSCGLPLSLYRLLKIYDVAFTLIGLIILVYILCSEINSIQ